MNETNKLIKKHEFINGRLINNNTCVICMNCYHTAFLANVLREDPVTVGRKQVRKGVCPKCGAEIREEITYKTRNDKIKEQLVKKNFKEEVAALEARKKAIPFFATTPEHPLLKYTTGKFFNSAAIFNPKEEITDAAFAKYVKIYFKLREFYKHITRKKFCYSSDEDDNKNVEFQYCQKLQNEMIYVICKHKEFAKDWFTDYSKLLKRVEKYNKTERAAFVYFILMLGKQIEDFEYLNYGLTFGDLELTTPEEWRRYNEMHYSVMYTTDKIERWAQINSEILDNFKKMILGVDSKKDETPVNDGDKANQLTNEMIEEYDRIIEEQKKAAAAAADNPILKEIEEEALQKYGKDFIIDV